MGQTLPDIDVLPDGLVVADGKAVVTHCNAVARHLLGVEEPIGRPLREVLSVANSDGADWFSCTNPYDGFAVRRLLVESSWYTPDGRELLLSVRLQRDRPAGRVVAVVVSVRDARSRSRMDRDRSDLVATVAHELRSPLTGVKGFTSTLLSKWERFNDSQRQLMLRTVDADADRLTRLIEDLLDVARIDTGRLVVRPRELDLDQAVRRQLESLTASGAALITLDSPGQVPVWGDQDRLAQVVANLVENATRHGEPPITVHLRRTGGGGAEIHVDDCGGGIPDVVRPRIFHKFWRHGGSTGSGLGLYIVNGIVAAHGGTVTIDASPSGGARMRVELPARPADPP